MSYGEYFWEAKRACIPHKDSSRAHDIVPIQNPMSTLNMALLSMMVTVAHMSSATEWQQGPYPVWGQALGVKGMEVGAS